MRPAYLLLLALVVLATGCPCEGEDCVPVTEPESHVVGIRLDDGDAQVGPAGTLLIPPLSVRTFEVDDDSPAVSTIQYSIVSGGGRLATAPGFTSTFVTADQVLNVTTNAQGFASARLVLGDTPGENRVKALRLNDASNRFVTFTARGHGPAAIITIVQGDGQSGEVGTDLPAKPAISVTDAGGIPVPDLRVWFIPHDGGLPLDGEVVMTSRGGTATMQSHWQLGPAVGAQSLEASVLAGPSGSTVMTLAGNPARFTATALAPAAASVAKNPTDFPDPQTAPSGQPVPVKPSVRVRDAAGRPVAGVPVRFAVTAGGGTLGGLLVVHERPTDANGIVTVPDWILGAVGPNTVTATVLASGVAGSPVTFNATATAALMTLTIVAGDNQSIETGNSVPIKPKVRVSVAGVGVSGVTINWTVTPAGAGSFLPLSQLTDASGYAELDYYGPIAIGAAQLKATTPDPRVTPSSVTFTITGKIRP